MFMLYNDHKRARERGRKIKRPPQMHEYLKLIRNQWASMSTLHRSRVNLKNSLYSFFFWIPFSQQYGNIGEMLWFMWCVPTLVSSLFMRNDQEIQYNGKKTIIYRKCYTSKSFGRTQNCMRISTVIRPLSFYSNFMFNSMTKWLDDILSSVFLYLLRNLSDFYM